MRGHVVAALAGLLLLVPVCRAELPEALDKADVVLVGEVTGITYWTGQETDATGTPTGETRRWDVATLRPLAVFKGSCPSDVKVLTTHAWNLEPNSQAPMEGVGFTGFNPDDYVRVGQHALMALRRSAPIGKTSLWGVLRDSQSPDVHLYWTVPDASVWTYVWHNAAPQIRVLISRDTPMPPR